MTEFESKVILVCFGLTNCQTTVRTFPFELIAQFASMKVILALTFKMRSRERCFVSQFKTFPIHSAMFLNIILTH